MFSRTKAVREAVMVAAMAMGTFAGAHVFGATIADWTFETSQPATAGPVSPETGAGSASGSHATAPTYSSPAGNGSSHSFSSNTWAIGDYYQFQVDSTGLDTIQVSFDQTSSNTGPRDYKLQYSTDGSAFTDFSSYTVLANASPNPVWNATTSSALYTSTFDLSAITQLNNDSSIYFRLVDTSNVSANGGAVGTSGTNRVDNVIISGNEASPAPEPASMGLLFGVGAIGAIRRRRRQ